MPRAWLVEAIGPDGVVSDVRPTAQARRVLADDPYSMRGMANVAAVGFPPTIILTAKRGHSRRGRYIQAGHDCSRLPGGARTSCPASRCARYLFKVAKARLRGDGVPDPGHPAARLEH